MNKARQAVSALEMSAVKDMSVEKAEELREIVYQVLDQSEKNEKVLKVLRKVMDLVSINFQPYEKDKDYRVWDGELYQSVKLTETEYNLIKEWLELLWIN